MTNTVFIMRGIPGSGKTTHAKQVGQFRMAGGPVVVCSADKYFIGPDGVYRFNPRKIKDAHGACQASFRQALKKGTKTVVVDNTNTQKWEFAKYLEWARAADYDIRVIRMQCDSEEQAREFAARNTHGVPVEGVLKMYERFEDYEGEDLI